MASYSVFKAKHATLVANTVDTVTLTGSGASLRVRNRHATADLYFTVNGTVPTVGGDDTYYCGPGENVILENINPAIKLISASNTDYSVELY